MFRNDMIDFGGRRKRRRRRRRRFYQATWRFEEGSVDAVVHFVVEAAGVAQIVARPVATPQRRRDGAAVDALAPFQVRSLF